MLHHWHRIQRRGRELGTRYWKYQNQTNNVYAKNGYPSVVENYNGENISKMFICLTRNSLMNWKNVVAY